MLSFTQGRTVVARRRARHVTRMSGLVALLVFVGACANDVAAPTSRVVPSGSNQDNNGHGGGVTGASTVGAKLPAPATVTATAVGTTVTVTWAAVDGAGEYLAQLESAAGTGAGTAKVTGLTTTFPNVAPGSYTVEVRARKDTSANLDEQNNGWGNGGTATVTVEGPKAPDATPTDDTPPVISVTVIGTHGNGVWYTSDVTVNWSVSDPESGVASSTGCTSQTVSTDTDGITFTCSATNGVGLSSASSATVKRDATKPTITFTGNGGSYTVDQYVSISCAPGDNLSGVASSVCDGLQSDAYRLIIGTNSLSGTDTDNAGNNGAGGTRFTVSVTTNSLCNLTKRWISNAGVANSLCVKLTNAAAAKARGDLKAHDNLLGAYANEVKAQTGKMIAADNAAWLLVFVPML